ncbi:hypothetical protein ACFSTE_13330 [Aquimarina hainanensis]|uniref:Phage portal protein n=1 Tax=Aquimarina hainanensis TaxID=1578017 RepID=A0ABW5NB63_9FLAO
MKSRVAKAHKEERKEIFNKRFGVVFHGEDNLKSLENENLIENSPTASQCAWIYESFLCGAGFEVEMNVDLSSNFWETKTANDLLYDVGESVSKHQGCFIQVRYNALYEKAGYEVFPYTACKSGKKDSVGYAGKIIYSPEGWGKSLNKKKVKEFDSYNPDPEIIQEQVEAAGGWEHYNGQMMFFKIDSKYTYPKSKIEKVERFADAEYHIGLFYSSLCKRGFTDITTIRHRAFDNPAEENKFFNDAQQVTGIENACSVWMLEDDWDDESEKNGKFIFGNIKSDQKPDRYSHVEQSSSNFIRKAFNIPPQLIDFVQGKLGATSGEDLIKAQSIYNASIAREKDKISNLFRELFRNFEEPINPENNWAIKQYSLLDDGTVN